MLKIPRQANGTANSGTRIGPGKGYKKTDFIKKSDAQAWEREFLAKTSLSCDMPFKSLVEFYMEDCKTRLKPTTWEGKNYPINKKLLPIFGNTPINEVTPIMIRNWPNQLMQENQNCGKGYSKTYLKTINNHLSAILNYAVKYYNLGSNPAAWVKARQIQCCSGPKINTKHSSKP